MALADDVAQASVERGPISIAKQHRIVDAILSREAFKGFDIRTIAYDALEPHEADAVMLLAWRMERGLADEALVRKVMGQGNAR